MIPKFFSPFASYALLLALLIPSHAATLANRWSFDTDATDSVGGNNGILEGGATVESGNLVLSGLGTGIDANRMSFTSPIDIGTTFGGVDGEGVTIETWYTDTGTGTWGKLFQFGTNAVGLELAFTHTRGNGEQSGVDRNGAKLLGEQITQNEEHHLVITVSTDGNLNTWVDGVKKLTNTDTNDLAGVTSDFEAIGATSWNDPGMTGTVNEFRIWSGELTDIEVAASFQTGPDEIFVVSDSDGDGLPDAWEELWFGVGNLTQTAEGDPDGDDLTNLQEFQFNPALNPDEEDTDNDGLSDGEEVNDLNTDPVDNDSDDDTLLDGEEVTNLNTNPLSSDSDGDFYPDQYEIANNTDPNDINDPGPVDPPILAHRWSFSNGMELVDSAGGNTGVLNATATISDNQLQLDGAGTGDAASSMRFTTPVDLASNFFGTGVTIETWYTDAGTPTWGKLFTFGTNIPGQELGWTHIRGGEDLAPGLDRNGAKQIESIPFGTDERLSLNEEHHLVITIAPDGSTDVWVDGNQEIVGAETNPIGNIGPSTESIGSTAWNDPGHLGSVNEFRIWKGSLSQEDVSDNFAAGPDSLPGASPLAITSISRDNTSGAITLMFNSIVGRIYRIDRASDLLPIDSPGWLDVDDSFLATSDVSTFTDNTASGDRLFYRVVDVTNQ